MELTLKGLRTRRNHWRCDVSLFESGTEAKAEGYGIMYDDEEGSVYGIGDGYYWDKIAFVPYKGYYAKYERRAIG